MATHPRETGESWKSEVVTPYAPSKLRQEFYGNKNIRTLGKKFLGDVKDSTPDEIILRLQKQEKFTKPEEIIKKSWGPETVKRGRYLSAILQDFFKQKCGSKNISADTLVALKFLNQEIDNVDFLVTGETVTIESGILTIKKGGVIVAQGAIVARDIMPAESPKAVIRKTENAAKTERSLVKISTKVETRSSLQTLKQESDPKDWVGWMPEEPAAPAVKSAVPDVELPPSAIEFPAPAVLAVKPTTPDVVEPPAPAPAEHAALARPTATQPVLAKEPSTQPGLKPIASQKQPSEPVQPDALAKTTPSIPKKTELRLGPDADYERNKKQIERNGISYKQEQFEFKGRIIVLGIFEKTMEGPASQPQNYLVLHDDENTAFDAGIRAIALHGGRLIALENKERRNFPGGIDTNRIFAASDENYPVAEKILALLGNSGPIISLHNNRGGAILPNYKNTHVFTAQKEKDPAKIHDMVWISGTTPFEQIDTRKDLKNEIDHYVAKGLNVVYEYVPPGGNDDSLSNWAALNARAYYNVEIRRGQLNTQSQYLETILAYNKGKDSSPPLVATL